MMDVSLNLPCDQPPTGLPPAPLADGLVRAMLATLAELSAHVRQAPPSTETVTMYLGLVSQLRELLRPPVSPEELDAIRAQIQSLKMRQLKQAEMSRSR